MLSFLVTYRCGHSIFASHFKKNTRKLSENVEEIYPDWQPIRIKFNYDYIRDQTKDKMSCQEPQSRISWGGAGYFCIKDDVLNETQKTVLIATLDNVKSYLESIFKVRRHPNNKIEVKNWDSFFDAPVTEATDCDFFLTITVKPYGDASTIASSASYDFFEDLGHRPRLGGVMINARTIPAEAQNHDSWNNKFFYHCVHEIFHALGISNYLFNNYHPPNSYKPYENMLCNITVKGKKMTFLTTPYSHKWAVRHHALEEYVGDNGVKCPSGIELEDMGGSGTEYGHPKARVYMTDLMVGMSIQTNSGPYMRFTDVSMAILLDTGNYKINYKVGQPILWGNKDSIDGETYLKDFPTQPPQHAFPEQYQGKAYQNTAYACFDYKCTGPLTFEPPYDCEKYPTFQYCKGIEFYNPDRWTTIGYNDVYDYMRFVYPNEICKRGKAALNAITGETKYSIGCIDYSFSSDNKSVTFSGNGRSFSCDAKKNGQIQFFGGKSVPCPDFERFRRSVLLWDSHFLTNPFGKLKMQYTNLNDGSEIGEDEDDINFDDNPTPQTEPSSEPEPTKQPEPSSEPEPTKQPEPSSEPTTQPETKSQSATPVITSNSGSDYDESKEHDKEKQHQKEIFIGVGVGAIIIVAIAVGFIACYFIKRPSKINEVYSAPLNCDTV